MKIFNVITPTRVAPVALAAAVALAMLGWGSLAVFPGPRWAFVAFRVAAPLLLLGVILLLRGALAAWAGAVLGLVLPSLWLWGLVASLYNESNPMCIRGVIAASLMAGIGALIGLTGFLSELPHLRYPHAPKTGPPHGSSRV